MPTAYSPPATTTIWCTGFAPGHWLLGDRRRHTKTNDELLANYLHDLTVFFTHRLQHALRQELLTEADEQRLRRLFQKILQSKRLLEQERGLAPKE